MPKAKRKFNRNFGVLAVGREAHRVTNAWIKHAVVGLPWRVFKAALTDPRLETVASDSRMKELVGQAALDLFDALGPVYGKAAQIGMSRLTPDQQGWVEQFHLTRLYGDWPALDWSEVAKILDQEIPGWRKALMIQQKPIGVASMAQVHAATDKQGRDWVVKVIKPQARTRMQESLAALDQIISVSKPFALTKSTRRLVKELEELSSGLRRELNLGIERKTITQMREKLSNNSQSLLRIPKINADFCTDHVLTIERFYGTPLSKIVADHQILPANKRRKLAKRMLQDLLIQVFEVGLFHADPHAGNLILLEDGSVGLFDWGLAGELLESDRKHIAAMLKAVIALDMEMLVDVLMAMAEEGGRTLQRHKVHKELKKLSDVVKRGETDPSTKPGLHTLIEASLNAAGKLEIPIPSGLLMMAKSLITIEGLAKGIDPDISLKRIAAPVLFKAARPGVVDIFHMAKKLPVTIRKIF